MVPNVTDKQLAIILDSKKNTLARVIVDLNKHLLETTDARKLERCKDGDHILALIPLVNFTIALDNEIASLRGGPTMMDDDDSDGNMHIEHLGSFMGSDLGEMLKQALGRAEELRKAKARH